MADDSKGPLGAMLAQVRDLWPVLAGCVAAAGWFYHLEAATSKNTTDLVSESLARSAAIAEVKAEVDAREKRHDLQDRAQDEHITKIDEARAIGLQRLATVEQGQKMTQDMLGDIRDKIDRMLMRDYPPNGGRR